MSLAWFLPLSDGYGWVDVDGVYNFACSLREVLAKHPFLPHGCGLVSGSYFPSFSEGLSLRRAGEVAVDDQRPGFPFLFGGAFIEAPRRLANCALAIQFPFLFGGAFIEAHCVEGRHLNLHNFPSFSEGLSLRRTATSLAWL